MLVLLGGKVEAASFNISASTAQVVPNGSFTVSVGGDCIGKVNLSVTNGTISKNSVWVEQNYQTISVKAGSSGSVTITATPTVGFSDADANEYKPGARSVKVTISSNTGSTNSNNNNNNNSNNNNNNNVKPAEKPSTKPVEKPKNPTTNTDNKTQEKKEEKSSNNLLSELNINTGNLDPSFDTNINEYSVNLSKDTQVITINTVSQDSKARVEGVGEINVIPGENIIPIKVIAEDNSEKIYTIKAYVDETPNVYLKYKDTEVGIVRNLKDVTILQGFTEKEYTVNEKTIKIFENGNLSVVYGVDKDENKDFYIIDTNINECTSKITEITIDEHLLYLIDLKEEKVGFEMSQITIGDKEIMGYRFKDGFSNYFLICAMNNEGQILEYLYEEKEGTLQLYSGSAPVSYSQYEALTKEVSNKQIIIYILSAIILVSFVTIIILYIKLRKEKE